MFHLYIIFIIYHYTFINTQMITVEHPEIIVIIICVTYIDPPQLDGHLFIENTME